MAQWKDLDLGFWRFPDQVVRLLILFTIALVAMLIVRSGFVPASFGELGHYRTEALDAALAVEAQYAGWQICVECHEEEAEARASSYHRTLSCEVCHGPSRRHAEEWMEGEASEASRPHIPVERRECLHCHAYLASRPTGFPQIIELVHNPMQPCKECHDPHAPTPREVPDKCAACHAQIASMKAISHHNMIACERCHETPAEHKTDPRLNPPKKPVSRDFCGVCHAMDAPVPTDIQVPNGVPRVDVLTHGGTYVCWQCHYPHFPEGR